MHGQGMHGQGMGGQGMAMAAEKESATATVEKVDKAKRRVTLMDQEGNPVTVTVPKNVKRFDQIKKGDQVTVDYYESVGVSLQKAEPGAQPSAKETIGEAREGGKLPGGMVARQMSATAIVQKVDTSENTVTIKGPEGMMHTIHITDPQMQKELANIKQGDRIQSTYTEALAIDVQRPNQKKEG